MAGKTKTIGTTEAVSGLQRNRALDFSAEYPGLHLIVASKKSTMHGGWTTQYDYFLAEGFEPLKQLPHPDKWLMGETWDNYKERKQISIDLHRANAGRSGVRAITEGPDIQTVQVNTVYGGEG